jgi:ribosomal protein S12 methylthiotransferase accessory factor
MDPVAIVGTSSATDAVVRTLSEASIPTDRREAPAFESATAGVVVDTVGAETFTRADDAAGATDLPWLAVELGGIGGYPLVEASVAGLEPDGPCYRCLADRVEANADPEAEPVPAPGSATVRLAAAIAARELVDLLDPDRARPIDRSGDAVLGRVIEIPHAERPVLPVPGCGCGPDADRTVTRDEEALDLDAALRRGERGLDSRVGIVAQVGEVDSYPAPYYLAELCDTTGFSDASAPRQAAGVAPDWDAAFMKALGESFERYAAGVYRTEDFDRARPSALDACVPPSAFAAPSESGSDGEGSPDGEIAWYPAEELATGAETSVPADLVVHPPPSTGLRPPITTGLGLGSSGAAAILAGLYEVIERDATMLAWYSTYEPLGLTVEDEEYRTLARRVAAEDLSITPLLLTQDVDVPVVAVALHRETFPQFAVGSAAHLDPDRAARDALAEAAQNWMELRTMGEAGADETAGAIGRYATDPGPVRSWLDPETSTPVASVGPADPPTGTAALDVLADRLEAAEMTAYAARTTTRDLAALGFEVVRVLVPAAQPLFLGDAYFADRAETVPAALGFEPRLDRDPHPFP